MKDGEIKITFLVEGATKEDANRILSQLIEKAALMDGVTVENITRFNSSGLIPSIDSVSFSRGIETTHMFEPGIAEARRGAPDHPFLTDCWHPDGTLDLLGVTKRAPIEGELADPVISEAVLVPIVVPDIQDVLQLPLEGEARANAVRLEQLGLDPAKHTLSFYPEIQHRYLKVILGNILKLPESGKQSAEHLMWMIKEINSNHQQELTKKHRWLGYIQGVLCDRGILDVDEERDLNRDVFKGA